MFLSQFSGNRGRLDSLSRCRLRRQKVRRQALPLGSVLTSALAGAASLGGTAASPSGIASFASAM